MVTSLQEKDTFEKSGQWGLGISEILSLGLLRRDHGARE